VKALNLELVACTQCPFYRNELVLKEDMRKYDNLHACRKSARGIIYADKVGRDNDPADCIPDWCELPNKEKDVDNGMQKASSEKEEGLSYLPTGSEELDAAIRRVTGGCGPG
jgi:hypothetical protein